MRPLPAIAALQCGVFSSHQALRDGWTADALRHAVRSDRILRVRAGAYQVADVHDVVPDLSTFEVARWRHAAAGIGAALTTSGAWASHSTAAVLQHVPLLYLPESPCLSVPPGVTGHVPDVHLHRCAAPARLHAVGEVGCPSGERTVVDLARERGLVAGVVAADYLLHLEATSLEALAAELVLCRGWPGVRSAREAVALADGRSESVLESRSRLALRKWGLPAPDLQIRIGNQWGGFVARVDFYWDQFGVVGEADGALKYDGSEPEALHREKQRQEVMEQDLDLGVVRWGTADLGNFGPIAARLQRKFAEGARQPRAGRRWTILPPLCPSQRCYGDQVAPLKGAKRG